MQLRFVHAADIHLGYEQYNLGARYNDFARAFFALIDYAADEQVDFLLLAGDLFHHVRADAATFQLALRGLTRLRAAGIPVVAIEGNHDTVYSRKESLSWLGLLGNQELLSLLNVQTAPNGSRTLSPFDREERVGSWIDIAGARIYGLKYYGAATARVLEDVRDDLESRPDGYTILMLHAGMEGQVPHLHGGLTAGQVEPLRERVDYLALGHIHKRLEFGDWVYNPGSLETNSMEEIEWPHGFFDVRVDTASHPKHTVRAVPTPNLRPFLRIGVAAEEDHSVEEFVRRAEERIAAQREVPSQAVIELHLGGVAAFRRQDVPVDRLKGLVESRFSPLTVRVRNNLVPPGVVSVRNQERLSRADLERQVIERLVYQHTDYRDRAVDWARLVLDVKNLAAEKSLDATIAEHVRRALKDLETPPDPGSPEAEERMPTDASAAPAARDQWIEAQINKQDAIHLAPEQPISSTVAPSRSGAVGDPDPEPGDGRVLREDAMTEWAGDGSAPAYESW